MAYVPSSQALGASARRWWLGPTIAAAVLLGITGVYGYRLILADVVYARLGVLRTNPWRQTIFLVTALWSVPIVLLLVFKTLLWGRYKPAAALGVDQAPPLTVVIPVYNEGAMVEKTIDSDSIIEPTTLLAMAAPFRTPRSAPCRARWPCTTSSRG